MELNEWEIAASGVLGQLRDSNQHRARRVLTPIDATRVEWRGKVLTNFTSNDYLGLSHHARVIGAATEATKRDGAGSGTSALISGYGPEHELAEHRIARWKATEGAILFPSGYLANHAAVQTLAAGVERHGQLRSAKRQNPGIRFLLDKLCHASLIDAVRGSGAPFRVFPHNHLSKLERLLDEAERGQIQVVLTESIFSMDGDAADLKGIAWLKAKYGFVLLLDEAHGSGVYGRDGRGLASEMGLDGIADVTVVTLSKAAGCAGGAVCGSKVFCDAVVNLARPYIYSTSVMPGMAAAATAAIDVMQAEGNRQSRVRELARRMRAELGCQGYTIPTGDSPIVPIILGSEQAALDAAATLLARGILVVAIRPPTVAKGSSRLRLTVSASHSDDQIAGLLRATDAIAAHEI